MKEAGIRPDGGVTSDEAVSEDQPVNTEVYRGLYFMTINGTLQKLTFATHKGRDDLILGSRSPPACDVGLVWPKRVTHPIFFDGGWTLRRFFANGSRLADFDKRVKHPRELPNFLPSYAFLPYMKVCCFQDALSLLDQLNTLEPLLALASKKRPAQTKWRYA